MSKRQKCWTKTRIPNLWRNRSGRYYARLKHGGKDIWRSLGTDVFEVAKRRLPEKINEERSASVRTGSAAVEDALDAALRSVVEDPDRKEGTKEYWREIISSIKRTWPKLRVDLHRVSLAQLENWRTRFARTHCATRTNGAISAWRLTFEIACRDGLAGENPAKKLKRRRVPETKLDLPSPEIFRLMVSWIRGQKTCYSRAAADMVEFIAYSGMRLREATSVKWSHINLERNEIIVTGGTKGTKNNRRRTIPIIPPMRKLLLRVREHPSSVRYETVLRIKTCRKTLADACEAHGIQKLGHHDIRHLFATTCIEAGVDIPVVSSWLGHSDGGALCLRTYSHVRSEHSQHAAKLVSFR